MGAGGEVRKILVEFLGDSRELVAASRQGETAVSGFSGKAAAAGSVAGKALGGGLIVAAAGLYEAGKAAADDEAAQSQLETQLKNNTNATSDQIGAVDEWIKKQAVAKGVAVDDLRPAMAKLATVTGDVGKAQRLLSIGMDISAGSGKDLGTVVAALAKAQNGSVGGLAKLGLATKDAAGNTKTFNQILQDSAGKYQGAAAKAAETTAGKQKVLGIEMHELAVQIGTAVLPVMQKLVVVAEKVVEWTSKHTKVAGLLLAGLAGLLVVVVAVGLATKVAAAGQALWTAAVTLYNLPATLMNSNLGIRLQLMALDAVAWVRSTAATLANTAATVGSTVATAAWSTVTKIAAAGQWLLNAALDANPIGLVVVAIALLVGGLILAYKHSETFRDIVNAAWAAVKTGVMAAIHAVSDAIGWLVGFVKDAWRLFVNYIVVPTVALVADLIKLWESIKAKTLAAFNAILDIAKAVWAAIKTYIKVQVDTIVAVIHGIEDLVKFVTRVFGQIHDAIATVMQSVHDLVSRLWGGVKDIITNGAQDIIDAVKAIPGKLADLVDNFSSVGSKLITAFVNGLKGGGSIVSDIAGNVWDALKGMINSAIDHINGALSFSFDTHIPGVGTVSVNPPDIPHLAAGGVVTRPTLALIGEAGPEAVIPLSRMGSNGGGGDTYIHISGALDPSAVAAQVEKMLRNREAATGRKILVDA